MLESNNAKNAAFNLAGYRVKEFHLYEPPLNQNDLSLNFSPSGKYNANEKKYILLFEFTAMYGDDNDQKEFLKIIIESDFIFAEKIELPDYFYPNSLAIVFPYIRAFVSTLSTLANMKPLILPVLNLGSLKDLLIQNTEIL